MDGHQLTGGQAGGGITGPHHGGDAVLPCGQGGMGGEDAAVGDDGCGLVPPTPAIVDGATAAMAMLIRLELANPWAIRQ